MPKTPAIDKEKCIGCSTCSVIAPKTFKLGDDGKAQVVKPPEDVKSRGDHVPFRDEEEKIKEAVDSCPVEAITL
jgi:ferredoxin